MCWSWTVCSWSPATAWGFNSSAFLKRDPGCLATTTCLRRPQDQVKFRMVVCLAVGIHNSNVRVLAMPLQLEPWAHVPPQHEDSAGVSTLETRVYKERGGSKLCVSTHTDRLTCVGICMKGRTTLWSVEIHRRMKQWLVHCYQEKLMPCLLILGWTRPWMHSGGRADVQEDRTIGALSEHKHLRAHERVGYALTRETDGSSPFKYSPLHPQRSLCLPTGHAYQNEPSAFPVAKKDGFTFIFPHEFQREPGEKEVWGGNILTACNNEKMTEATDRGTNKSPCFPCTMIDKREWMKDQAASRLHAEQTVHSLFPLGPQSLTGMQAVATPLPCFSWVPS